MILVTVGTHELPFDRLIRAARGLPGEVVVQRGTSRVDVPGARVVDALPPSELQALVQAAEIVVCHGGPGTLRAVLAAGKVPLVVPRRRRYGEHVDDHQVAFARRMAGRVHLVEDPADLLDAVAHHAEVCRFLEPPVVQGAEAVAAGLRVLLDDPLTGPTRGG